jgi:hypothetical protein
MSWRLASDATRRQTGLAHELDHRDQEMRTRLGSLAHISHLAHGSCRSPESKLCAVVFSLGGWRTISCHSRRGDRQFSNQNGWSVFILFPDLGLEMTVESDVLNLNESREAKVQPSTSQGQWRYAEQRPEV